MTPPSSRFPSEGRGALKTAQSLFWLCKLYKDVRSSGPPHKLWIHFLKAEPMFDIIAQTDKSTNMQIHVYICTSDTAKTSAYTMLTYSFMGSAFIGKASRVLLLCLLRSAAGTTSPPFKPCHHRTKPSALKNLEVSP